MLEFIGTVAICFFVLWLANYLWRFWNYRQSINAVEALASAVKNQADFVSSRAESHDADKVRAVAACLQGIADSLSYGKLSDPFIAATQLQVLESMIASPDDIAFFMNIPIDAVTETRLGLVRARESFVLLHRAHNQSIA